MSARRAAPLSGADAAEARARMVERQLRRRGIGDERVLQAMGRVPRELFVPENLRHLAYADGALPIGFGQTISQPFIVATICSLLGLAVAAAAPTVPQALYEQLAEGGRLVVPRGGRRGQELVLVERTPEGTVERRSVTCRFVPLLGEEGFPGG